METNTSQEMADNWVYVNYSGESVEFYDILLTRRVFGSNETEHNMDDAEVAALKMELEERAKDTSEMLGGIRYYVNCMA